MVLHVDTLILTTRLEMNRHEVVCPYYALLIKLKIEFILTFTRFEIPYKYTQCIT